MTIPKFLQAHVLTDYTGVLLNRDEFGAAKRLSKGGVSRIRISSQCKKSGWRHADGPYALTNLSADSVRTKQLAEAAILTEVRRRVPDVDHDVLGAVMERLNVGLYGKDANDDNKRQTLLFGMPEIEWLQDEVTNAVRQNDSPGTAAEAIANLFKAGEAMHNFSAFRNSIAMPGGLTGAMFGRMVTADVAASIDGAVHVGHAFTTHGEESESDFFTTLDDLKSEQQQGGAFLGNTEINSGVFYQYLCIDEPTFAANTSGCRPGDWLEADRELAARASAYLIRLAATVSPKAKRGSTAGHAYAQAMVVEFGERIPRSLGGAYTIPARPNIHDSLTRLVDHMNELDRMHGEHEVRRIMGPGIPGQHGQHPRMDRERHTGRSRAMTRKFLIMRLESSLMSFGGPAIDRTRPSNDFPGRSMLTGMLAFALGWTHHTDTGRVQELQDRVRYAARSEPLVANGNQPLIDRQNAKLGKYDEAWTTKGVREKREGEEPTFRLPHWKNNEYRVELRTTVALELTPATGGPTLEDIAHALDFPARPLFIGRKTCLPEQYINRGIIEAENALEALWLTPTASVSPPDAVQWDGEELHPSVTTLTQEWASDMRDWKNGIHTGRRRVSVGLQEPKMEAQPA